MSRVVLCLLGGLLAVCALSAETRPDRYALILSEPPLVQYRRDPKAAEAARLINLQQTGLRSALADRQIAITGSTRTLLNAVYVAIPPADAAKLADLPGVRVAVRMRPIRRHLTKALDLIGAGNAWNILGGKDFSGLGVEVGILDSGIDQTHPTLRDPSLQPPAGFPKCGQTSDCAFTNSKVIVARSYVASLVLPDDPRYSHPDDLSARDRMGHGTAVASIVAGNSTTSPLGPLSGVAPKAFLGNYKIFGSPGVNEVTFDDVLIQALEDAYVDGMDIVTLPIGNPALWGPLDTVGSAQCPVARTGDNSCDPKAMAVENAIQGGLTVVVSAGNDGDLGNNLPTFNSINSPGSAPSAITVGATSNAHNVYSTVRAPGNPALARLVALRGNGPRQQGPVSGRLVDVSRLGNDGKACSPISGSVGGGVALILRGDCTFATKVNNAQQAGAIAAIVYQPDTDSLFPMQHLESTGIPSVLIGNSAGAGLKSYAASNANAAVILDPALVELSAAADQVPAFTSQGPGIATAAVKPEVAAPGVGLYMATQTYDPNGELYDPSAYAAAQGTSFSAALAAGVAALVKQRNPPFTPAQVKSALVNTASSNVTDPITGASPARLAAVGMGKLSAGDAVNAVVTASPATVAFGVVNSGNAPSPAVTLANTSNRSLTLSISVVQRDPDSNAKVTVNPASINLAPNQSQAFNAILSGNLPVAGSYEGYINVQGSGTPLRIPYTYTVSDGVVANAFPLENGDFVADVGQTIFLSLKATDRYGVPLINSTVQFRLSFGGGQIQVASPATDPLGIAQAKVTLPAQPGEVEFSATVGSQTVYFDGRTRLTPAISAVVNAASLVAGQPVAPGSYITIFGRGLAEAARISQTPYLPISLGGIAVSFDRPDKGLSIPGRLFYVSDSQVNVQVPWEFQGLSSVQMKVYHGDSGSLVSTVPLNDFAPAFFEYRDAQSGNLLAAALDQGFQLITPTNPAQKGKVVQFYVNGLGPVKNHPPSGEIAPVQPLLVTDLVPSVSIGGQAATVLFNGLAPQNVGLYQVNALVPAGVPSGLQPVVVTINGVSSKTTAIPVQ